VSAGKFCSSYSFLKHHEGCWNQAEVEKMAPGLMQEAERYFVLTQTDNLWKEHLQALKFVQQAVGLRGYAQRDPLIEYKLEGYNLFLDMMAQIRRNVIYSVYQVSLALSAIVCLLLVH
jgi:preprotein translocase subunit SecA